MAISYGIDLEAALHTWSLAVEEQFYFLFPLALWLVMRLLFPAMAAVSVLSLALSLVVMGRESTGTFYLLPTRAWELTIGGIVAVVPAHRGRFAFVGGVTAILAAALLYNESMPFPGLRTAAASRQEGKRWHWPLPGWVVGSR